MTHTDALPGRSVHISPLFASGDEISFFHSKGGSKDSLGKGSVLFRRIWENSCGKRPGAFYSSKF